MRYLRYYTVVSLLMLVLIIQNPAFGQTESVATHVVINEVDSNPNGDDSKSPIDWVELYNPTNSPVDVGGWTIGATTGLRQTYTLATNTMLQSKQFLVVAYGPSWFPHVGAVVQLKDKSGDIVDYTPPLTDIQGDSNSWQRRMDGYDTNSTSDWVFKPATPGSSNGKIQTSEATSPVTISVSTNKPSFTFGDSVKISGQVSRLVMVSNMGYPQQVNILVNGPDNFQKKFTLYPDVNLQYTTTMKIDQLLGFREGVYDMTATYGNSTASSKFAVSPVAVAPASQEAPLVLHISTDKKTYYPSETVTLNGNVSKVLPLTPVSYKVYDPDGSMVYQGNLFPDDTGKFTTFNPYQSHSTASGLLVNTINPIYGVYKIIVNYDKTTTTAYFTLSPRPQQTANIVVKTDKSVYGLNDTVTITGSTKLAGLQNVGMSPNLEILQSYAASESRGIVPQTFDMNTLLNVQPDNTFVYKFPIPNNHDRLGNYRIIVSTPQSKAETDFVVAQNPSTYKQNQTGPFSIVTDKSSYAYGNQIVISGKVQSDLIDQGVQVQISVFNSTGGQMYSQTSYLSGAIISKATPLSFFAYPDSNGNYVVKQTLTPSMFTSGTYVLKASYGNLRASTTFSVYNPLDTGNLGPIVTNLNKQVYGLGETVNLSGKISSKTSESSSYTINLLKPDGTIISNPLMIKNGFFSWNWTIPNKASYNTASTLTTDRKSSLGATSLTSIYGIYRISITSDFAKSQLFFQVSPNPQNQTSISPFVIETDKPDYTATDTEIISGQVLPESNIASSYANNQVQIFIYTQTGQEIYRYFATVNAGGQFHIPVSLDPGIWTNGTYRVLAQYDTSTATTTFTVKNLFVTSSASLQVFVTTDHKMYLPGQTVLITGRTSHIISITNAYLTFGLENDTVVNEGQVTSLKGNSLQHDTASFDQYGSFTYDYPIPKSVMPGNYTIFVQVPFGLFEAYYLVVNQLPTENMTYVNATQTQASPENVTGILQEPTPVPTTIGPKDAKTTPGVMVDKKVMISEPTIPIKIQDRSVGNKTYYPREMDGLLRLNPGDENSVGLRVTSTSGSCVIGTTQDCKIHQSTVQPNSLYQSVNVGNETFLVGFSGQGQRIQEFSIIPQNKMDVIKNGQWEVDVIKKDQITRFYYQILYVAK